MGDALPFTNMEALQSENRADGTYYYADVTEDGQIIVVNTVLRHDLADPPVCEMIDILRDSCGKI